MLKIVGLTNSSAYSCQVDTNNHVPITFRTQREPLGGARYIRLGNLQTSLLELIVPANSMTIRGLNVTLVRKVGHELMTGIDAGPVGLPILELSNDVKFTGPPSSQRVNIASDFSLAVSSSVAEFSIQDNKEFDTRIAHGNVWFLIKNAELVGVRFTDLNAESIDAIKSFDHS